LIRSQARGHSAFEALFLVLPRAVVLKAYAKFAQSVNGRILNRLMNEGRLRQFNAQHPHAPDSGSHFFVIVMPDTLHFLLPCLRLIPRHVRVSLLYNGAQAWERRYLRQTFPEMSGIRLWTLPRSSLAHGDVLSLLLRTSPENFAVLDHDLYVFDPSIFENLTLGPKECMRAIYREVNPRTGITYPLTYFLVLNAASLRAIMTRFDVDARLYREAPRQTRRVLEGIGLGQRTYLKDYHSFFDTLHVLLALAYANGEHVGYIEGHDESDVIHIGGTSGGSYLTKDLFQIYARIRFLEHASCPMLRSKYAKLYSRFTSSEQVRGLLSQTSEADLAVMDNLMARLGQQATP